MNKLVVVEDIKLNDDHTLIEFKDNVKVDIKDVVKLIDYMEESKDITFNLNNDSKLFLERLWILNKSANLVINMHKNSDLELRLVVINEGVNTINLRVNMLEDLGKAKIYVRIINKNKDSNINFICDGNIEAKTIDNNLLEDLKGLILDNDTIKISPNMQVATNEVMANHLVTVGSFNLEELFYLESKGLSRNRAKELLVDSFLKNILGEHLKKYINGGDYI